MKKIIEALLKHRRGLYTLEFAEKYGLTRCRVGKMLWVLLALGVIRVKQPKRARIFHLTQKWEKRLNHKIGNEENINYGRGKQYEAIKRKESRLEREEMNEDEL